MDLSLAEGSGLHLLAELRRTGYQGRVAVLTSQGAETYERVCLDAGADAFYDKASGLETLFDELSSGQPDEADAGQRQPDVLLRDGLTGLHSEAALGERIDQSTRQALRDSVSLAVYVMRLKGFKDLESGLADQMAKTVATRLRDACSDADIVARRTLDQFCVVLTRLDEVAQAAVWAQHFGAVMAEPMHQGERDYRLDVEMGMALFPTDAVSSRGLLTLAEATAFGAL